MKSSNIITALLSGTKVCIGEFRDWDVRETKRDGKPAMVIENYYLLIGRDVVTVQRFAKDGVQAASLKRPEWAIGTKIVVAMRDCQRTKWGTQINAMDISPYIA